MAEDCGEDLKWEEDYEGIDDRPVSAVYFELPGVSINRMEDWERIYAFLRRK